MTCSLYCRTRKFLMVVYHYGRKQWQYYHIEISSRKFFSKLSANVFNENLKRNTWTNKLVFNAVFTRFLNFGKRIRSLAIFYSDDKIFFPVFFFLVVFVFFCKVANTAILFSPKINLSILRPIYFTPPLFVYHLFTVIFEFIPYPCGASEWFRNYFKLQLNWVYAQVAAFHNDVSNNFEINMIASRTASQLFLSNDDLSMT